MKYFVFLVASLFLFSSAAFAEGVAGGVQEKPKYRIMQQGNQQMPNQEEMVAKRLEMLTKKFNLTVEQRGKVKEILTVSAEEFKKFMQESQAKVMELKEKERQAIDAILTKEQKASIKEQLQSGGKKMPPMQEGVPQEAVH